MRLLFKVVGSWKKGTNAVWSAKSEARDELLVIWMHLDGRVL